jgi:deoxyribose-phosphate aldolase
MPSYTYQQVAGSIDHSLLQPQLTRDAVEQGIETAKKYITASVCVRPCDVAFAAEKLAGTPVKVCTVIGFPHGSHTTATKVFEAKDAMANGATELDMVLNIGWLKQGRDAEVEADIAAVNKVAKEGGATVKVIFENAYLNDDEKVRACRACEAAGVAFVKTSTGYASSGSTPADLKLMRANVNPSIGVKAAGGVRTLDALIEALQCGATRVGATATAAIVDDFLARPAATEGVLTVEEGGASTIGGGY